MYQAVAKIIGEFYIDNILSGTPDELWKKTGSFSGIAENFYKNYFKGCWKAYAIKIGRPVLYKVPIEPSDVFEIFFPPQSFRYLINAQQLSMLDHYMKI